MAVVPCTWYNFLTKLQGTPYIYRYLLVPKPTVAFKTCFTRTGTRLYLVHVLIQLITCTRQVTTKIRAGFWTSLLLMLSFIHIWYVIKLCTTRAPNTSTLEVLQCTSAPVCISKVWYRNKYSTSLISSIILYHTSVLWIPIVHSVMSSTGILLHWVLFLSSIQTTNTGMFYMYSLRTIIDVPRPHHHQYLHPLRTTMYLYSTIPEQVDYTCIWYRAVFPSLLLLLIFVQYKYRYLYRYLVQTTHLYQ